MVTVSLLTSASVTSATWAITALLPVIVTNTVTVRVYRNAMSAWTAEMTLRLV